MYTSKQKIYILLTFFITATVQEQASGSLNTLEEFCRSKIKNSHNSTNIKILKDCKCGNTKLHDLYPDIIPTICANIVDEKLKTNQRSEINENNTNSTLTTKTDESSIPRISNLQDFCRLVRSHYQTNQTIIKAINDCRCSNKDLNNLFPDLVPHLCGVAEIVEETEIKRFPAKGLDENNTNSTLTTKTDESSIPRISNLQDFCRLVRSHYQTNQTIIKAINDCRCSNKDLNNLFPDLVPHLCGVAEIVEETEIKRFPGKGLDENNTNSTLTTKTDESSIPRISNLQDFCRLVRSHYQTNQTIIKAINDCRCSNKDLNNLFPDLVPHLCGVAEIVEETEIKRFPGKGLDENNTNSTLTTKTDESSIPRISNLQDFCRLVRSHYQTNQTIIKAINDCRCSNKDLNNLFPDLVPHLCGVAEIVEETEIKRFPGKGLDENNTNSTLTIKTDENEIPHIPTIEEFCRLVRSQNQTNQTILKITSDCRCKNKELNNLFPDIVPSLCGVAEIVEKTEIKRFPGKGLALASVTTVTMAFGLTGNLLVIAVLFKNRKTLPYTKVLISQLAFVDALFSVNNFISEIHLFWSTEWVLGLGMCKFISSTYTLSSLLSIGYILIIALERFFGILYSMQRKLSSKHMVYGCVAVNFIVGIAAVVPLLVTATIDPYGVCYDSHERKQFERVYNWVLLVVYIIIPMLTITYIYLRIIRYLIVQAKQNTAINREDIRLKRNKSNQRTMKILLSIMIAFVVCVLPTRLFKLYHAYFHDGEISWLEMEVFRYVTSITYSFHVCVNPIIYSLVDRENRYHMLEMIGVVKKRCDSTSSTMRFQSTVRGRRVTQFTVVPP